LLACPAAASLLEGLEEHGMAIELGVADEFFFIVHDARTGKLRLNERSAGLGLSAALLSELILRGNIDVESGTLTILDAEPPEDDLSYRMVHQLAADRQQRSLRTWLLFFSHGALDRVAIRLTRSGRVEAIKNRRPWGTVVRYLPTDMNEAVWPANRLHVLVTNGDPLDFSDAMLAGLVAVTGLTKQVWLESDALTMHQIAAAVASLPISLREVLAHTEAAVGDATITPH
jgi:Golgi phosphoprotein 3 (GPP34)